MRTMKDKIDDKKKWRKRWKERIKIFREKLEEEYIFFKKGAFSVYSYIGLK